MRGAKISDLEQIMTLIIWILTCRFEMLCRDLYSTDPTQGNMWYTIYIIPET